MNNGKHLKHTFAFFISFFLVALSMNISGQGPVISDIPDQIVAEGNNFEPIYLDEIVSDENNKDDQLIWSYSNNDALLVTIESRIATVVTKDENWNGFEIITFTVSDPDQNSTSDDATFTVTPVNDAPVLQDIEDQTIEKGESFDPISLDAFVTDVDNTSDQLKWIAEGNADLEVEIGETDHIASINTPNKGWKGSETITFTVTDIENASASDDATFTVNARAKAPEASDDNYSIPEAGELIIDAPGVLGNDMDDDDDPLTAELVDGPSHSLDFTLNSDGSFNYLHDGSETSLDAFIYQANDGSELSEEAVVTIEITPVNDAPVFHTDIIGQTIDLGASFDSIRLDDFVSDADNTYDQLSWIASGNTNVSVDVDPVTHIADVDTLNSFWMGSDTVTFTVSDLEAASAFDTAIFIVKAPNELPVAVNDTYGLNEGASLNVGAPGVLENDTDGDGDPLLALLGSQSPAHSLSFTLNSDGSFNYTNDGSEASTDAFTYQASDGSLLSNEATVNINISPVNDAPVFHTDIIGQTIFEGSSFDSIRLDDYVSDADNTYNQLSWVATGNTHILVNIDPMTHIADIDTINGEWLGSDTITFIVSDLEAASAFDTATFIVLNVAEAPVAVGDSYTVSEGGTLNVIAPGVLSNDTDGDGDPLTADDITGPANSSSFTFNTDGSFTYTHNGSETTSDAFTYRAFDGTSYSNTATVNITITPVNDPPDVTDIPNQSIAEGATFATINLDSYVSDPDHADNQMNWTYSGNTQLTVSIISRVATITAPSPDWYGAETITFTATDPLGASDNDQATFTITSVNDPPVVADIPNQTIAEGATFATINLDNYVSDVDHSDNQMIWTYSGNTQLTVSIVSRVATITAPSADWYGAETITFTATDPLGANDNDQATFTVTSVNDPPVVTNIPNQSIAEGLSFATINLDDYVSDVDHTDNQMTWTYSGNSQLTVNISGSRVATITPPTSDWNGSETITFIATDPLSGTDNDPATFTITPVNDPPVLTEPSSSTVTYVENAAPIAITSTITVYDVDDINLISGTVVFTNNYQNGQDILSYTTANGITGIWNASSGTLSLSGTSSYSNYQTALRSVRYSNSSENPNTSVRTLSFTVNDGTANSNTVTRNLTVTSVNDIPTAVNDSYNVAEGGTLTVTAPGVLQNDTDPENSSLTAYPVSNPTHSSSFTLNLNGSFTYIHDGSETTSDAFTYRAYDGTDYSTAATVTITITPVNDPPVATGVSINPLSDPRIGITNTGVYTFSDPDGDLPGTHIYAWYRANNSSGTGAVAIPGATGLTYTPVLADGGRYISFEITPVDEHGLAGTPVRSSFKYINAAPVASNVHVYAPNPRAGSTIYGRFSYYDLESNARGNAVYQWYRSPNNDTTSVSPSVLIKSGTDSTYTLSNNDAGMYIFFKVRPVATTGSTPGALVGNYPPIGPIGEFSATISGSATYCPGISMPITLTITGGKAPYIATLTRSLSSNNKDTVIGNIPSSPYYIQVKIAGSYLLKSLTDANNDSANIIGTPVVLTVNPKPTAVLTGTQGICNDGVTTASLSLDLTGTAPWNFTIRRGASNDTTYSNISADPYTIHARVIGSSPTTYRLISLSDANCTGDTIGSGTARVYWITSPTAALSGRDTICPGQKGKLKVTLTGTSPWSITYLRNGANPTVVNNITNFSYDLEVTGAGTYTLSRVQDAVCTGRVSGTGIVTNFAVPTGIISGSATICEHITTNLNIALTGNAPWKFSYRRNSETPVEVLNVTSTPKTIPVKYAGTYVLTEVYDKNCPGTVSGSAIINVTEAPEVEITGLAGAYNLSTLRVPVFGNPTGGTFAYHPALIDPPPPDTMYFYPIVAGVGTHNIIYSYRDPTTLCYGYDTAVVRVITASATIIFEDDRTKYCNNDEPFTIVGVNLANDTGSFTITGNAGLVNHYDNTASIYPSLLYTGDYTLTYTYFDGTYLSVQAGFEVGNKPVADFNWESECYHHGQPIAINDASSSTFGFINSYKYKIFTETGYDSLLTKNIEYTFQQAGNHNIELQITTSYGCESSIIKTLGLRPVISLKEQTYFEDFESMPISWRSATSPLVTVNSWMLGEPGKGFSGAFSGYNCWYTYIPTTNAPREQSWVTSPCFDFTGVEKPMVKLNIWRLFNSIRDGAVLQASSDSSKSWQNIGLLLDGVNWFNEYNLTGATPGGQNIGWSNIQDDSWIEARHSLDRLKDKKDVQFRLAYGSDGTARNTDGIAFDDFWIGERNRTALIEHFTNSSDELSKDANQILNDIVNSDSLNIIDLQYHTSFPGDDPFNEQNPYIPSSRILYYGLTEVPYSILSGGATSQYRFDYDMHPLEENMLHVESLYDSKFWINVYSQLDGNTLNIETEVSALQDIPVSELTVHVAIIERRITGVTGANGETSFESVVKTMLPDAGGTTIYKAWIKGEYRYIYQSWNLQNVYNTDELRIVAFIQNEATHEIYQAAIHSIGDMSDIDDPLSTRPGNLSFVVYPNPSSLITTVKFNDAIKEDLTLEIYNSLGGLILVKKLPEGTRETGLYVEDYPDGIYIIRIMNQDNLIGISKLTISK
jgi:VCBS repeat-containing protein